MCSEQTQVLNNDKGKTKIATDFHTVPSTTRPAYKQYTDRRYFLLLHKFTHLQIFVWPPKTVYCQVAHIFALVRHFSAANITASRFF